MKIKQLHQLFLKSSGVSTDTRKIQPESVFFALKGENFNGNEFSAQALQKGASYAVIDEIPAEKGDRFILVEDVLRTLQELAAFHRKELGLPIIALTGSNGKTTTKELMSSVLSRRYKTVATAGNLNNHIGVPLTLLSMTKETEIGIVEMGANHQKEIAFLCSIAQPDYGYITNFGKAHLEGFGSLEGVIKGKSELYDYLKAHQNTLFLNYDDPVQKQHSGYKWKYGFGRDPEADLQLTFPEGSTFAEIEHKGTLIHSRLIGAYNAKNMAAAFAVGTYFKIPIEEIKAGIENYSPQNNRSQIIEKNTNKIILDAYNANPTSMAAALENFDNLKESPKLVFLGDMFEMGPQAEEEHQQLVHKLKNMDITEAVLIGENFFKTANKETKIRKFRTFEDFRSGYSFSGIRNSLILIKGSRGMALERIMDLL